MCQHMPGLWIMRPDNSIETKDGETVASFVDNAQYRNLIVAAPAMYEALSELVKYLREEVADEALDTWAPVFKAAMALAQAEGKG